MTTRKTSVSAIALLLASAGAAAAFPATSTTNLNVRSGPGPGYPVVDTLRTGETVDVTARSGSWYQVDGQGWASANYLDAEGGTATSYVGPGYGSGYGPVAFYYDDYPYYYDDAGFYFFIRDGRRHRVGWDWFNRRDNRDFRWSNTRYRNDFERRRDWQARRGVAPRVIGQDQRAPNGDLDRNGELRRGERVDTGNPRLRTGRASAEGPAGLGTGADVRGPRPRVGGDGRSGLRSGGNRGGVSVEGGGSGNVDMRRIPGGGY